MSRRPSIAVIGAGISGLRLARLLHAVADVRVFDKSRGFGGRMSTRRAEAFQFDHGAQYFTTHGAAFQGFLEPFLARGTVARWSPRLTSLGTDGAAVPQWTSPRYVAVPGMNALGKAMAEGLDVQRGTRIAQITRAQGPWHLTAEDSADCGVYDWVVCTAPAEQTLKLMPQDCGFTADLRASRMQGCYSLMIGLDDMPDPGWDAAVVHDNALAWIAMNHSKPGRSAAVSLLCQSSNDWAEAHMEDDQQEVRAQLLDAFQHVTGIAAARAPYVSLHRWRFAKVETAAQSPFLIDAQNGLAAAGDWCGAGRVEAGFDSATALAHELQNAFALVAH